MMRIAYLLSGLGHTGGSLVLYRFMDELVRRDFEVSAVLPRGVIKWRVGVWRELVWQRPGGRSMAVAGGKLLNRLGLLGDIVRGGLGRAPREPAMQFAWMTRRLVERAPSADVYIGTYCTTAPAAYVLGRRSRGIYHAQHFESIFFEEELGQALAESTYLLPLELVCNSSWLQQRVECFTGRKARLLLPGIDTDVFRPLRDLRRKFLGTGKTVVVSYYSPVRFKAWPEAVEAMREVFAQLGERRVEWRVFGGRPESMPQVPVQFVGVLRPAELARLYNEAHVVFMNSWCESFPLPPLEGMACGAAVVTTRPGTEDYAVDGVNCLVVEPRQPKTLAEAVVRLAGEREYAMRLAEAGVETGRRFEWGKAGDALERILRAV